MFIAERLSPINTKVLMRNVGYFLSNNTYDKQNPQDLVCEFIETNEEYSEELRKDVFIRNELKGTADTPHVGEFGDYVMSKPSGAELGFYRVKVGTVIGINKSYWHNPKDDPQG